MGQFITVEIDNLKPGMFVESVAKQKGALKIKTQGKVTSVNVIQNLKNKGLLAFIVDLDKSDNVDELVPSVPEAAPEEPTPVKAEKSVSFEQEIGKASTLYSQAKQLQKKLLHSIKTGLPVNFEPIKELSDKFVESLDRNPNALLCMTHLKEKDEYLLEHSLNVGILMGAFGKFLQLDPDTINELALAGMLHDIGKIEIKDTILLKPAKLTDDEMAIMKSHVNKGLDAIQSMVGVSDVVLSVVAQHHERLDGSGYPHSLEADDIDLYGRMIAIVDCYDAMTADRCYKKGMPPNQALKILLKSSQSELDRELVSKFIKHIGIHPVGSLVKLGSEKLSLVTEHNNDAPLCPKVTSFYSLRTNHFTPKKDIDLASKACQEKIVGPVRAQELKIDYKKFFKEQIAAS